MSGTVASVLAAVAVAVISVFGTLGAAALSKRTTPSDRADYAEKLVSTSHSLLVELRRDLEEERERSLRCERRYCSLVEYLKSMGLDPPVVD